MKILYLTLSKIELDKQGIYSDLINALSEAGHEVTVLQVCEPKDTKKTGLTEENGIRLLKVVVGDLFGVGFIKKGINTLKIEPMLIKALKTFLSTDTFDLVLYATPPITFAGVVSFAKKKYGCRSFLMLKDIFPQNAVDIGLFSKKGLLYTYFRRKEKALYALSDRIGCMSDANRKYLFAHNPELDDTKVLIFPNTQKIRARAGYGKKREEGEALRFVFGGNFGKPQAIDFLLKAIGDERMQRLPARFLFAGNGSETEKVRQAAEKYANMEYIPFMPADEYDRFMADCDVGIISLDHRFTIPNYPSRVLSYMAMAKPVLAATDPVTDIRELVLKQARCGLWCASDDKDAFIDCVRELTEHPEKCREYGENGRRFYESHFDVKQSVACIETIMKGMEDHV